MKVSSERIPESQVLMTIEVEPERLAAARGKALRKLAPRAKVPGFRPGKAPPAMIERYLGEERILDEALDALVPDVYREAVLADESIKPVARPRIEVETTEPLVVKATIPVRPTVELGDYNTIRAEREAVVVDEKRVDETLLALRRRSATLEPVERELRWRDIARMDVRGVVGDETLVEQEDVEVQLTKERDVLFPGFEEAVLRHKKGETVEFDLPVPDAVRKEGAAGKQCHFTVAIKETKEEVLPELDDDFAKQLGDGFESLAALRERVRDDIRNAEEQRVDEDVRDKIMGELVDRSTIEFPPVMLDSEVDHLLREQMRNVGAGEDVERYAAIMGKTEAQAREELRPIAEIRLRRSLVLSKVAEQEKIEAGDDEIASEIDRLTSTGAQAQQLREILESEGGRDTIRRNILTRTTLSRLVELATTANAATPANADAVPATKDAAPAAADVQE